MEEVVEEVILEVEVVLIMEEEEEGAIGLTLFWQ